MPRLWRFLHAHPDIDARISASMKLADFAADGVDVAIRLSKGKHPELHVEKLFDDSMLPVCSPRLVEQGLQERRRPRALSAHPLRHPDLDARAAAAGRTGSQSRASRRSMRRAACT